MSKGRYDNKEAFIERLEPIIRRQIEIYRESPEGYIGYLPLRMNAYFSERSPSKKITLAYLLAASLIATHRSPTAEYIWKLMHEKPSRRPDAKIWHPHDDDEGLTSLSM
jgi:hypothetical protein